MVPPCSFCPKIFKEKAEVIELLEVQRCKQEQEFQMCLFCQETFMIENFVKYTFLITTSADADIFCAVICTYFN